VVPSPRQCHVQQPPRLGTLVPRDAAEPVRTDERVAIRGIVCRVRPRILRGVGPRILRGVRRRIGHGCGHGVPPAGRRPAEPGVAVPVVPDAVQPAVERRDSDVVGHLRVRVRRRASPASGPCATNHRAWGPCDQMSNPGSATTTTSSWSPWLGESCGTRRRRRRRPRSAASGRRRGPRGTAPRGRPAPTASSYCLPPTRRASRRARPDWRPADPDRCRRRTRSDRPAARAPRLRPRRTRSPPGAGRRRRSDRGVGRVRGGSPLFLPDGGRVVVEHPIEVPRPRLERAASNAAFRGDSVRSLLVRCGEPGAVSHSQAASAVSTAGQSNSASVAVRTRRPSAANAASYSGIRVPRRNSTVTPSGSPSSLQKVPSASPARCGSRACSPPRAPRRVRPHRGAGVTDACERRDVDRGSIAALAAVASRVQPRVRRGVEVAEVPASWVGEHRLGDSVDPCGDIGHAPIGGGRRPVLVGVPVHTEVRPLGRRGGEPPRVGVSPQVDPLEAVAAGEHARLARYDVRERGVLDGQTRPVPRR